MILIGRKEIQNGVLLLRGRPGSYVARLLLLALLLPALPAPAQVTISCSGLSGQAYLNCLILQNSGSNSSSGSTSNPSVGKSVAIIGAVAVVAVVVAAYIIVKKSKAQSRQTLKLEIPSARFDDVVAGKPAAEKVSMTNLMSDPVFVKSVAMEDPSGEFTVGDSARGAFTLAPGERFDIPVTVSGTHTAGRARLRIVITTAKTKQDEVRFVGVSYGHRRSKLGKLIP